MITSTRKRTAPECDHLGAETGERMRCRSCAGKIAIKVFRCAVHGTCTRAPAPPAVVCPCEQYQNKEGSEWRI